VRKFTATSTGGHRLEFSVDDEGDPRCKHLMINSHDLITGKLDGICRLCGYHRVAWTEPDASDLRKPT
jgi:hypothetical protein